MPRLISLLALAALLLPSTAHAGPPWVSIELPANPLDPGTRGALFVVHSYHHEASVEMPVVCTAEGLVDGARRTMKLTVSDTRRAGVRAVRGTVPADGTWMVVCVSREQTASATALVDYEGGEVVRVRVPHRSAEGGRWNIPVEVSARQIDAMLRERARTAAAPVELAGLLLLLLVPAGWLVMRKG